MKILHTESSMHWGGQEFRTLLEHNYLNNHHHESWLMYHPESVLYQKATSLGVKNILGLNLTRTWRLYIALRIANFCRSKKIDLINSHSTRNSVLCLIAYVLGAPLIRSRQITNPIKKTFAYRRGCSHIIAADIIKKMLTNAGVEQHKITVIGEGVDLQEFNLGIDSTYLKSEFNLQDNDKVITNIGMIRADKGQKFSLVAAISILKRRSDVKFFLV